MDNKAKKRGRPKKQGTQQGLYKKIYTRKDEIIQTLFKLLKHKNENIKLGAAKVLINKLLPDLKATELSNKDDKPLIVKIVSEK